MEAILELRTGSTWVDTVGCGAYPFFIISDRFVAAWNAEGLGRLPIQPIRVAEPYPAALRHTQPPGYFWIDGEKLHGANFDFDAAGYVGVRFCATCGRRTHHIRATGERQMDSRWSYTFLPGTWNGLHLFTTDLSPTAFFCTDHLVRCASAHRLTNLLFIPIEYGNHPDHAVQYLSFDT